MISMCPLNSNTSPQQPLHNRKLARRLGVISLSVRQPLHDNARRRHKSDSPDMPRQRGEEGEGGELQGGIVDVGRHEVREGESKPLFADVGFLRVVVVGEEDPQGGEFFGGDGTGAHQLFICVEGFRVDGHEESICRGDFGKGDEGRDVLWTGRIEKMDFQRRHNPVLTI